MKAGAALELSAASDASEKTPDTGSVLKAALVGAVAAVAFTVGAAAACPKEGAFDTLPQDIVTGAFGAAFSDVVSQLVDNTLLSAIVSSFLTGFIFELTAPK